MTVPAFTVRDLTWRSYAVAQPEHGDIVLVRMAEYEIEATYEHGAFGAWVTQRGRRFRAIASDQWRLESER